MLQSTFYGTGRTKNIPFISGICNFALIIPFWLLAKLGLIVASFDNVMALFVIVFALDFAIACLLVRRVMNQSRKSRLNPLLVPVPVVTQNTGNGTSD